MGSPTSDMISLPDSLPRFSVQSWSDSDVMAEKHDFRAQGFASLKYSPDPLWRKPQFPNSRFVDLSAAGLLKKSKVAGGDGCGGGATFRLRVVVSADWESKLEETRVWQSIVDIVK
ncbi:WRKY DNA-binding protein 43 [Striga asiatica]|uniref:WRKY DNA-binding protein 43 n=1 Tax=Striga asiatica TaxID=4170 RepID=A0A5A7QIF6_STRAF|nr:WRKY DNA-binding protein 43 [Striga asiatica]